jgi:hypothetical protein
MLLPDKIRLPRQPETIRPVTFCLRLLLLGSRVATRCLRKRGRRANQQQQQQESQCFMVRSAALRVNERTRL